MKTTNAIGLALALLCFVSCHNPKGKSIGGETENEETAVKGELAFLLDYNGKKPEDVGFLTNHIVERRMANLMKDSFVVMSSKTKFSSPIAVSKEAGLVAAKFFNDKELSDLSAMVIIDAGHEIFWVYYYNGDKLVKFTDNPSATPALAN